MTKDFNILVKKISAFRNRYYFYKITEGFIITSFLLVTVFTLFSFLEYFIYLDSDIRKVIFYGFIVFGFLLTVQFIIIPLLKLFHIIKPIDIKGSSRFIQNHFADIKDKLLNIIELSEINDSKYSADLLKASIDQKIADLNIFNFKSAVQFKNLKIIILYFLVSAVISISLFLTNRSFYTEPVKRIVHYKQQFIKPAPFSFHLINNKLIVKKGEPYKLAVECKGDIMPDNVYLNIEGSNYLMRNISDKRFEYEIPSVINNIEFYFTDLHYRSESFELKILPSPGINKFDITIEPPAYTGLNDKTFNNVGDLQVPAGTHISWRFAGIDIDSLYLNFNDTAGIAAIKDDREYYTVSKSFYKTTDYNVIIENFKTDPELALSSTIDVVPDLYPEIKVVMVQDSIKMTRFFFKGIIGDDYGFTNLGFHFNIDNADSSVTIPVIKNLNDQDFYFSFDFASLKSNSGSISYYFKVTDNDVINNYKSTTSNNFVYNLPDRTEVALSENEQFKNLERMLQESRELTNEIQNDLRNMRLKNMDSNITDWEKSQMANDIISKQNRLEQLYEEIKLNNEKLNNYSDSYNPQNESIKEKQQQIEELLEEVFTDELRELLEEFNKLAQEYDSKKFNQLSNKMNLSYEDLQNQVDRNLEMLKRMKVEKEIQNVIDELTQIGIEEGNYQKEISESKNFEEILPKVSDHKDNIEYIQKKLNEALKINSELNKKINFDHFEDEFFDINKSIDHTIEKLNKRERRKSENSLKETSDLIENAVFAMQQMLNSNNIEQQTENIKNLMQILGNLIYLSFTQEDIIKSLNGISNNDPLLNTLNVQQKRIYDQNKIVRDSLYALAKRTPQINSTVNNELLSIEFNLEKTGEQLGEGHLSDATVSQQYVMTSLNNLALLLNEALENLEKQLANAKPGDCNCENPQGGGKEGMNLLKETSENIRKQLEKMIDQLKGGNPDNMSEQFGQMLMEHEMMQQMLRDIMNNGSVGSGAQKALQQVDEILEQNRQQLLNKNISSEMISRQNLITTRLLEAEKADLEREFEEKRERQLADDFYSNPVEFFEFIKEEKFSIEMLNRDTHKLTNFYNKKFKDYINKVEN
jgi:hypothetical protein